MARAVPVCRFRVLAYALALGGTLALALGGTLALGLGGALAHAQAAAVRSVPVVDLARYVGKWYEIAAFPMLFQRRCIGAKAWAVEGSGNARLKVSFFWPFRADYWIVGLDEDYRWAVVGNPNRKYLWVLSRTPRLPREQLDQALQTAAGQGYDLEQLKYTDQGRGAGTR